MLVCQQRVIPGYGRSSEGKPFSRENDSLVFIREIFSFILFPFVWVCSLSAEQMKQTLQAGGVELSLDTLPECCAH